MNKNMLAKEVAVSEKVTLSTAFKTVDAVLRVIAKTLAKGESVNLRGFGAFTVVNKPERILKNIHTGKPVTVPAHKSVRFKPSKETVTKLNK
ncbi:HU family DNA-binding protein [Hallella colorans]|uniref:HU family DNA-binding protein n=1 Tax=Hallella colorans TaxID=1703337 RepID=UPI0023F0FB50|nr:HU family DNA-binding protein [Hallella colorans]